MKQDTKKKLIISGLLGFIALAGHSTLLWLAFYCLNFNATHPSDMPVELLGVYLCLGSVFLSLVSAFIMFTVIKRKVAAQDVARDATFALHWTLAAAAISPFAALVAALLTVFLLIGVVFTGPIGATLPYIFISSQILRANDVNNR